VVGEIRQRDECLGYCGDVVLNPKGTAKARSPRTTGAPHLASLSGEQSLCASGASGSQAMVRASGTHHWCGNPRICGGLSRYACTMVGRGKGKEWVRERARKQIIFSLNKLKSKTPRAIPETTNLILEATSFVLETTNFIPETTLRLSETNN
jgi:hypothetical protein